MSASGINSANQITLPKWTAVGEIAAANIIPALDQVRMKPLQGMGKLEVRKKLLDKIDLTGLGEWSLNEQKEAWGLITEYAGMFACE